MYIPLRLTILFFLLAYGCRYKPGAKETGPTLRDSLLTRIHALDKSDTTENYYQIVKAYASNDTVYLRRYIADSENDDSADPPLHFIDSCVHQPGLRDINADEAYRFIYGATMCPYEVNITISKAADYSKLHFVIYERRQDSIICINEYEKHLSKKDWDEIVRSLNKNDFWGRKKYNGINGIDGSTLTVFGFKKGEPGYQSRYHQVYRRNFNEEALVGSFRSALIASGNRQGCFGIK